MWNFSKHGYVSIVQKDSKKPDELTVRGRDKKSLQNWCRLAGVPQSRIHTDWPSDYPWRLVASRDEVEKWALAEVRGITYRNFKNEAEDARGKLYHDMLSSIWVTTHRLTPEAVKRQMRKSWAVYDAQWRERVKGKNRSTTTTTKSIIEEQFGLDDDDLPEDHISGGGYVSMHDLTTDEWNQLMSDAP